MLYSKYNQWSVSLLKQISDNIKTICIDNVEARKIVNRKKIRVPCIMYIDDGITYMFTDDKMYDFLKTNKLLQVPIVQNNQPQPQIQPQVISNIQNTEIESPIEKNMISSARGTYIKKGGGHEDMATSSLGNEIQNLSDIIGDPMNNPMNNNPMNNGDEKYPSKFKKEGGILIIPDNDEQPIQDNTSNQSKALTKKKKDLKEEASKMEEERRKEAEAEENNKKR